MPDSGLECAATRLRLARISGAVPPLRDVLDAGDISAAYRIQDINTARWIDAGRCPVGWKIGVTSAAAQRSLQIDQPTRGVLFGDTNIESGGLVPASYRPLAEAEIAIVLGRDLPLAEARPGDVAAATATACVAIEIADTRIIDWNVDIADMIADNAGAGWFVLGPRTCSFGGLKSASCAMNMKRNGSVVATVGGAGALNAALAATAWLARSLVADGRMLRAGDVILTGALAPPQRVVAGDVVCVSIAGVGHCSVTMASAG